MINYEKIEKYSVYTLTIGLFFLSLFSLDFGLGFLLGGLASICAFRWLQRLETLPLDDIRVVKKALNRNKLVRYLIYALALFLCFIRPNIFNYIACFLGIFMVRFWFVFIGGKDND